MWFAVLDNYLTIKEVNKTPKVVMTKTIETLAVHTIIPTFIPMRFKLVSIFVARITNISYFHRHGNSIHQAFLGLSDSIVVSFSPFIPSFVFPSLFTSPISSTSPLILLLGQVIFAFFSGCDDFEKMKSSFNRFERKLNPL